MDYYRTHQSDIRKGYFSGIYDAISRGDREVLYTIEFQKRGLSHCHTLLWIDDKEKIQCAEDIDRYISTELPYPNEDPEGYRVVSEMMIHGPYGPPDPSAPCLKEIDVARSSQKDTTMLLILKKMDTLIIVEEKTVLYNKVWCRFEQLLHGSL
nr:DNA helicase [Tanacetum cinerariifolium]